jgi:hypothetical protein
MNWSKVRGGAAGQVSHGRRCRGERAVRYSACQLGNIIGELWREAAGLQRCCQFLWRQGGVLHRPSQCGRELFGDAGAGEWFGAGQDEVLPVSSGLGQ